MCGQNTDLPLYLFICLSPYVFPLPSFLQPHHHVFALSSCTCFPRLATASFFLSHLHLSIFSLLFFILFFCIFTNSYLPSHPQDISSTNQQHSSFLHSHLSIIPFHPFSFVSILVTRLLPCPRSERYTVHFFRVFFNASRDNVFSLLSVTNISFLSCLSYLSKSQGCFRARA